MRWARIPEAELHFRGWDDECAVFNSGTGHTHLLNSVAVSILQRVLAAPCSSQDVVSDTAAKFGLEENDELVDTVGQTLCKLQQLDLIESQPDQR